MKTNQINKQILDSGKEIFDDYFNGVLALQKQLDELTEKNIEKAEHLPEEGRELLKKVFNISSSWRQDVVSQFSKVREDFENALAVKTD